MLQAKIRQLELLSLLRGADIQKLILEEENKMPVTIDITKDLRYQQGREDGIGTGAEQTLIATAKKMFANGLDISLVQNITGLDKILLEEIAAKVAARS